MKVREIFLNDDYGEIKKCLIFTQNMLRFSFQAAGKTSYKIPKLLAKFVSRSENQSGKVKELFFSDFGGNPVLPVCESCTVGNVQTAFF